MSQSNIKERTKNPVDDDHQEDDLDQYQGKWAICYVLYNGETSLNSKSHWRDTSSEILDRFDEMAIITKASNSLFLGQLWHNNDTGLSVACMFNSEEHKRRMSRQGYPIVISMFPIPIAGD